MLIIPLYLSLINLKHLLIHMKIIFIILNNLNIILYYVKSDLIVVI